MFFPCSLKMYFFLNCNIMSCNHDLELPDGVMWGRQRNIFPSAPFSVKWLQNQTLILCRKYKKILLTASRTATCEYVAFSKKMRTCHAINDFVDDIVNLKWQTTQMCTCTYLYKHVKYIKHTGLNSCFFQIENIDKLHYVGRLVGYTSVNF